MKVRKFIASVWLDAVSLIVIGIVFVVPFIFIFLTACQDAPGGSPLSVQLAERVSADREPSRSHGIWRLSYVPSAMEQHDPDCGLGCADRLDLCTRRLRDAAPRRSCGSVG